MHFKALQTVWLSVLLWHEWRRFCWRTTSIVQTTGKWTLRQIGPKYIFKNEAKTAEKHPVQLKQHANWKYVLFKKGTVIRSGCPDTHQVPFIFTALHEMQRRSNDENSVRLSVKRVDCDKLCFRDVGQPLSCNSLQLRHFLVILTALHGMQTRSSDENSVCLSVCSSVCQTHELWQNGRKSCPNFYTIRKII